MQPEAGVPGWLRPGWTAPARVRALMSTRRAWPSASGADFAPGRDGSQPAAAANRAQLAIELGARPVWLRQVHGLSLIHI